MAIFGRIEDVEAQLGAFRELRLVLEYLKGLSSPEKMSQLKQLEKGKVNKVLILGEDIFSVENRYMTKTREEGQYEAHKKYIDIQFVAEGEEKIEVTSLDGLHETSRFNEEKDYAFYSNAKTGSIIHLKPGMVAIFFPEDAHMPGIRTHIPMNVIKCVVKYSVNLLK